MHLYKNWQVIMFKKKVVAYVVGKNNRKNEKDAPEGNRTPVTSMATTYATTIPLALG